MSKSGLIRCILALVLTGYLVVALSVANNMAARDLCRGFDIEVDSVAGASGFVSEGEISRLLSEWKLDKVAMPAARVPLQTIENRLNAIDNIEKAQVTRMADNRIHIAVTPMIPVARVFDSGHSYYINRDGKRLTANARYRLDVPMVVGHFDARLQPRSLVPLLERIASDPDWNAIVSQVSVDSRSRDIILVPMIRGHVINLGDTADLDSKLERVMAMYHKVLPVRGWDYYDTLSVKWGGQVVATRRLKSLGEPIIRFDREGEADPDEDISAMVTGADTDTVASAVTANKKSYEPS